MRAFRLIMITSLVAAGIATGAPSAYADTTGSLGVSPGHGSPDAQFTVALRWQPSRHGRNRTCTPDQITFNWDGSPLGTAAAAPAGDSCVASLQATPPAGAYQGVSTHTISVDGVRGARVAYRVVAGAGAAATNPQPSTAPTGTATPDSLPSADAPTDTPAAPAGAGSANSSARAVNASDNGGLSGFAIMAVALGVLLFLAGAGIIGAIVWRGRRAKQEAAAEAPEAAAWTPWAAADPFLPATQQMPIPRQAGNQDEPETIQMPPVQGN